MKKYGHIISGLRKKHGLTQDQLGKKLNVSYQAVSKWENDLSEPDLETLEKLTNIFGISMSEFFDMANSQESSIKKTININDNDIKKDKNFLKTKPWYLVAGLGVLILILSLCALLIPVKYSGKQVFDKYESSVFYLSAKNSYETKSGTGFFINDKGLAVTIYENIKNCTSGKITLNNGKKYDIKKIVGVDKENNLAIIQIGIKKSTPVKFGDSNDIEMGDKVYSITYTTEDSLEDANSVLAEGMIYKVESNIKGTTSIQTTATTSKANKGGVLFNEYGKVIGIISSKLNVSGVGFDMVNVCEPIKLIDKVKRNINLSMDNYVNNLYTLTFYNPQNQVIETKMVNKGFVLGSYEKTGYIISGLYNDENFEKPYNLKSATMASQDIYVDIRPIQYIVVFDANGAEGTMESQTFYYDQSQGLKECEFYIANKMFKHWQTEYNGRFADGATINNLTAQDNKVITFTAVWEDLKYNIIFDANGGSGRMNNVTYSYDSTFTLPYNLFYKTGYTFSHWECGENTYQDEDTLGHLSDFQVDFVLKAIWVPITYKIKYSASNFSQEVGTVTYDQGFTLTDCYYKNQIVDYFTYNGQNYNVGDNVINLTSTNNKTVTLNIVWKGVDFKINYYTDETNFKSYQYTWGDVRLAHSGLFSRVGYTCSGFTAPKFDNQYFSTSSYLNDDKYVIEPNETLDFMVRWSPIGYTVVIDNYAIADQTISCKYDEEYTVPDADYMVGHTLINYNIKVSGEVVGTINIGEKFSNLTSVSGVRVYLVPNWEANKITLNFYNDGQLWKTDVVEYNSTYLFPNITEEKEDMWFNGWLLDGDCVYPGEYNQIKYINTENNFTAKWSKKLKGEGTDESPYLIETYDDLCSITHLFGNYKFTNKTIKLMNDIDCENRPVPTIDELNYTTFDGNNKIIKNVQFERALFGLVGYSTIYNLGVENYIIDYTGDKYKDFAGFAYFCYDSTIENCWTVGKINANCYRKSDYEYIDIGGFCASVSDTTIKNCYSKTEILFTHSNPNNVHTIYGEVRIGGFTAAASGTIENCYSITSFNTTAKVDAFIYYKPEDLTITNCFYGHSTTELGFLDNPELLNEFQYKTQVDNSTIKSEVLENLYDLDYLQTLNFDNTIWVNKTDSFPTLKSFEVQDENNN